MSTYPDSNRWESSNLLIRNSGGELLLWLALMRSLLVMGLAYGALDLYGSLHMTRAPRLYSAGLLAWWVIASLAAVIALFGLWRAARANVERGGAGFWSWLARMWVVLGLAFIVLLVPVLWPVLSFHAGIVWDPTEGQRFELRFLEGNSELEFKGKVTFGASLALEEALAANPGIGVVQLESPGGALLEGYAMASAIRERRLTTRVVGSCDSACVVAFAAGEVRLIGPHGRLGLHAPWRPDMRLLPDDTTAAELVEYLVDRGVERSFAERGMSTPSKQMWEPSVEELLASGLVTGVRAPPVGLP